MARKSRYQKYMEGLQIARNGGQVSVKQSSSKSVLQKLKDLKGQEFRMSIPIGGSDGE